VLRTVHKKPLKGLSGFLFRAFFAASLAAGNHNHKRVSPAKAFVYSFQ
jgi:hypothetical protein